MLHLAPLINNPALTYQVTYLITKQCNTMALSYSLFCLHGDQRALSATERRNEREEGMHLCVCGCAGVGVRTCVSTLYKYIYILWFG